MKKRNLLTAIFMLFLPLFLFTQDMQQRSLSDVLDHSGRIKPGINGSFSTQGFSMHKGENGEPIFLSPSGTWFPLGSGINGVGNVTAIAISGNDVYVGGTFSMAGGIPARSIAKWNVVNSSWSALGSGIVGAVLAIAISGNDLYAGGSFNSAGGISANNVAKWNILNSSWTALSIGMNQSVNTIAISGNDVYAGGYFTTAGGISANYIAKWNVINSTWSPLGSGMDNRVLAIAITGNDLYAGGEFYYAGGIQVGFVAKWSISNSSWSVLGSGVNGPVFAIAISGNDVFVGGDLGFSFGFMAKWNVLGSSWSAIGSGMDLPVYAIAISTNGDVYAGGWFSTAGGISTNYVAKYNVLNSSWSALESGVNNFVHAIAVSGNDVYVGGWFTSAGGIPANRIAKWADPLINGNIISGTAFRDLNSNNVHDPGEPGISNSTIRVTPGPFYFLTNAQGLYNAYVGSGNFTVSIPNPPMYCTPSPLTHSVSFSGIGNIITDKDFALFTTQIINDVEISLSEIAPPRPGFFYNMKITYKNVGTQTLSNDVSLYFPSDINYSYSVPAGNVSGNSITWQYSSLLPGETRFIDISFNIPATMPLGTQLVSTAFINPTDLTSWNNIDTLTPIVIGSFDPNDKQVFPAGNITPQQIVEQDSLIYQIRFQNTGTADAITVVVRDTMSDKLDMGTFEMISASHNYVCTFENNRELKWTFDNINLPDSNTNEPGSHGYIKYRIKPKSNLVLGDEIRNTAYIYFDFNEAVITNTTISTVANPIGIVVNTNEIPNSYSLQQNYPNPFNPTTNISFSLPKAAFISIRVYDVLGREVDILLNGELKGGNHTVNWDASVYPSGVYFYKLESGEYSETRRMVLVK